MFFEGQKSVSFISARNFWVYFAYVYLMHSCLGLFGKVYDVSGNPHMVVYLLLGLVASGLCFRGLPCY